jgi:hypothetical protein
MTEISISEFGKSVSIRPSEFSSIEDIWPDRVELLSTQQGDYELIIPYGVGEGSTGIFKIKEFQLVHDATSLDSSYALPRK